MNREIRFRVWNERYEEFSYWGFIDNHFKGIPTGAGINIEECKKLSQQFTGMIDSCGIEIYEGDICLYDDPLDGEMKVVIEWHQHGLLSVVQRYLDKIYCGYDFDYLSSDGSLYRIIGNIHQHPELIKNS